MLVYRNCTSNTWNCVINPSPNIIYNVTSRTFYETVRACCWTVKFINKLRDILHLHFGGEAYVIVEDP